MYSLRLVSKLWLDLATTWFMERVTQLMKNWAEGVPSMEEFECQAMVSVVKVNNFCVVVGLENGEMIELMVVLQYSVCQASCACSAGRLDSWTCCGWGTGR